MDYYKRLGVGRNASPEDIKKAYKKLAMQHHPDKGGNQKTFQEINEAYDTLKDPRKRQQYDNPQPEINVNSSNFEDVFSQFFGGRGPRQQRNPDIKLAVDMTLEEVLTGKDVLVTYMLRNGQQTNASLRIHAGVNHGQVIRFKGIGDNSIPHIQRGDLLVLCKVKPHNRFERDRHHLRISVKISVLKLMLGTYVDIVSLTGSPIRVTIPKGTNPGTILSVAGHGLPDLSTNRIGNLYVTIKGTLPTLTLEQERKVKELDDASDNRSR